jgi:delta 1-pyrroline-5-carboxylate dehydrogenase
VPVIVARDDTYDAMRLLSERTVTINTTASGGNASLLSLEEQEPA